MKKKIILLSYLLTIVNSDLFANNNPVGVTRKNSILAGSGESFKNEGLIEYKGDDGMHSHNGGSTSNEGIIHINGASGILVEGIGSKGVNKKTGIINNKGKQGMQSNHGGEIINEGTIHNTGPVGMYSHDIGSSAINRGTILTEGSYGMAALSGATVINEGTISNIGDVGINGYGAGSHASNEKTGVISNKGNRGIYVRGGSSSINKGIVSNVGDKGAEIDGIGSSFINEKTISNTGNNGIYVINGASALNDSTGEVQNEKAYGMSADGKNSLITNKGIIFNKSDYGMSATHESTAINDTAGLIKNTGAYGMSAVGIGSTAINKGTISNIGDKKLHGKDGAVILNEGTINNIINGQSGIFLNNAGDSKNIGTINVTKGIGVKAINSNFYNSGTINATDQTAIEMDDTDSILELGAGTLLRGTTDGLAGEDTLILSGKGLIDVGDHSVHNFEKLVVTGDVIAKGTYNLSVSNGSNYQSSAFGSLKTYNLNDVTGATGDLTVDGTINVAVDYDGIGSSGTDKTGKIIAKTITKTNNGHIVLVNGGKSALGIIGEAQKNNSMISGFRINAIATVSGAQVVDPDFFTTSGDTVVSKGWRTMTVGDRIGNNGSILLDQKYLRIPSIPQQLTPPKSVAAVPYMKPTVTQLKPPKSVAAVPGAIPYIKPTATQLTPPKQQTSKILVPRNRLDLDSMNELTRITNNLTNLDSKNLKVGEDKFTVDYLGTKGNSKFKGSKSYNYDYDVNSDGVATTYMYKLTKNFSLGTGFSYENNNVKYNGVKIGNTNIVAPKQNHKEKIDSYNSQLFGKYQKGNFNLNLGLGLGLSTHEAKTNFVSGIKTGKYNSYVLKTGVEGSYNYKLTNKLELVPTMGIDYINVSEDSFKYKNGIKLESANGAGYAGTLGLKLRNREGKFRWDLGAGYKYNSKDTFHNTRKVSGYDLEVEKLNYDRKTLLIAVNGEYDISEEFLVRAGYEYENNKNYKNNNINIGFTYKFNSVEDFVPVETIQFLNISEYINFKFDSYNLTEKNERAIKKIVNDLKSVEGNLTIEGHTDSIGTNQYNQKLSEKRAQAVNKVIKNNLKNDKIKVTIKGVGEENPIFPNDTIIHKEGNRTVKVKFNQLDLDQIESAKKNENKK